MLPFLTKKKQNNTGIAMVYRTPDEKEAESHKDSQAGLEAAVEDLLRGIHSHDKKLVLTAIQSLFEILEAQPHEEGPSEAEESEEG